MKKWLVGSLALLLAGGVAAYAMLDEDQRAVVVNMPTDRNVLFWDEETRTAAFRAMDRFPALAGSRMIEAGDRVLPLPEGEPLDLGDFDLDGFMQSQNAASVVVVHDGAIVLERYGLDFDAQSRWTSFSVAKSLTSTLVGAALLDGAIESLDDPVTKYVIDMRGSAYDDVTIRQLLTMSSGVRWSEDYGDPESDVARFNEHVPEEGVDATVSYLRGLPRDAEPGTRWRYNTGETNLIGVLVSEATGKPLAEYLSEKVWTPFGMQQDATWLLGQSGAEIGGCCIQATTRDFARFGLFVLADGVASGERMVPEGWFAEATASYFPTRDAGIGYGYQWWIHESGGFAARGLFGQGIFIDPERSLVIATNSNWRHARGSNGESAERNRFYDVVQQAVDGRERADEGGLSR